MQNISYRRHRFHPDIIRKAVWIYFRFTMSYRDVEDLLAERGIDVSYETIRLWVLKFGQAYARRIRKRRPTVFDHWHIDGWRRRSARRPGSEAPKQAGSTETHAKAPQEPRRSTTQDRDG